MASAPMDALASFVYLTDHLPTWISQINTLATHVVTKREEFTAEYKRVLEHARPKRKKTPSITSLPTNNKQQSLRSQKNDTNARDTLSIPRPTDISPLEPANKYLFANARRGKRRQGTSFRSCASGPQTFRNQHQVIIYYDSILQDSFEGLVKDIGTARNNLRKGKQAKALERGLRLPSFGSGNYSRTQRGLYLPALSKPRLSTDIAVEPKPLLHDFPPDDDASFTQSTKDLEAAQALCESAAHQFLRDGDCTVEINKIRAHLENALAVAKAQIETWQQENREPGTDVMDTETAPKTESHDMACAAAGRQAAKTMPVINAEATEIEVDSDDDTDQGDMVIDISRFRSARMSGLRA